jgi:uncharacterized protein YndB with AHSA1/START domain
METKEKTMITVATRINAPVDKVWEYWTNPVHIMHWNNASDDWHTTRAENDLRFGGRFLSRMEARDGSSGFNFSGVYREVEKNKHIEYTMDDGRRVMVTFQPEGNYTNVRESFETEQTHPVEMQQEGWQSILDNFKNHVESSTTLDVLHFEIEIDCKPSDVYEKMLDEELYREWTAEFNPSSHFKGSWEKGSKMLFLGTDTDGSSAGMVSYIKDNVPNKFVSIEHRGIIKNGDEVSGGSDADSWKGLENYTFTEVDGKTLLSVDMDSNEEFKTYFTETWPKALKRLKAICERKQ